MAIVEFQSVSRVYTSGDHELKAPDGVDLTLAYLLKVLASEYEMKMAIGVCSYLPTVLLTVGMALLVSLMVARKNRKIDMVEALKGQG